MPREKFERTPLQELTSSDHDSTSTVIKVARNSSIAAGANGCAAVARPGRRAAALAAPESTARRTMRSEQRLTQRPDGPLRPTHAPFLKIERRRKVLSADGVL